MKIIRMRSPSSRPAVSAVVGDRHPTGLPLGTSECRSCAWIRGGTCGLLAPNDGPGPAVDPDGRGCIHHEPVPDCFACGACCREAFDLVPVEAHDERMLRNRPDWVVDGGVRRCGSRCAALVGDGPYRCVIYADRPSACSELDAGSDACLFARRRVGLSPDPRRQGAT
jgi:hypothetical protein